MLQLYGPRVLVIDRPLGGQLVKHSLVDIAHHNFMPLDRELPFLF